MSLTFRIFGTVLDKTSGYPNHTEQGGGELVWFSYSLKSSIKALDQGGENDGRPQCGQRL
jgi:hypothetical protein